MLKELEHFTQNVLIEGYYIDATTGQTYDLHYTIRVTQSGLLAEPLFELEESGLLPHGADPLAKDAPWTYYEPKTYAERLALYEIAAIEAGMTLEPLNGH